MKWTKYITIMALLALVACDTEPEALDLQPLKEYSEEYYQALRDYKASEHEICYVYYADWAPIEGASGYKDPASWGERIIGLPDSIDIVNLWMGIPTPETHPVAYQDMIETRTMTCPATAARRPSVPMPAGCVTRWWKRASTGPTLTTRAGTAST